MLGRSWGLHCCVWELQGLQLPPASPAAQVGLRDTIPIQGSAVLGLEVTILVVLKFSLKSGLSPELLLLLLSPSLSL